MVFTRNDARSVVRQPLFWSRYARDYLRSGRAALGVGHAMSDVLSVSHFARRLHCTLRRVCCVRRSGHVIGWARWLRPGVQTACPSGGSLPTPGWPGLWPSPASCAPGVDRIANMFPSPRRWQGARGDSEGKIKGPARGWPQTVVCTCGEAARGSADRVPWRDAWLHGHRRRRVLSALVCACLVGSVADGAA